MATIPDALAIAIQNHQAGRLQAAEQAYRQILAVQPDHAEAIHLLGVIAAQVGRPDDAVACCRRAVELKPDYAAAHNNLGNALRQQGKLPEAVASYRRAVELMPDFAMAHSNLGVALKEQGILNEAIASCCRAVELIPDYAEAHNNLGNALRDQGKLDQAVARYRRAVQIKPDYAEAHANLGWALMEQTKPDEAIACWRRALEIRPDYAEVLSDLGNSLREQAKPEEAVACLRRAVELKPDFAAAHNNLGNALWDQKKPDEAVACWRRALSLNPDFADAHNNLGNALRDHGKLDDALTCFHRALEIKPDYFEAHSNLGNALKDQGKLGEAIACYQRSIALKPNFADAHYNLGNALKGLGKLAEAIACYRRALELKPDYVAAHDNLLMALQYRTGVMPAELAEAHAEYDRLHTAALRDAIVPNRDLRDTRSRRPRVGFVSPDLGRHPVGYFLVRVLENFDKEQFETVCYSDRTVKDDLTQRMQSAATQWRDVIGLSHQRLAHQIRADRIDILFDLAGHTAGNRLSVFARKPAPIQITWIGYEGTTGLAAMDYLIADRHVVPEGSEGYYRERVLRMPGGYLCYDPPAAAPPVGPLPALARGYATFGSFNNPAKITAEVVRVWAGILRRAQSAKLVLKYRGLDDPSMKRRYLDLFAAQGVPPNRLEILPASSYAEYLAAYSQLDVALDPFPFSGSATTCEALWMGVPVVTCPGATFAGRHSLSHLLSVGLTETVVADFDEYVDRAISLAGDLPRLAAMRAALRERMATSPLCDGRRFADQFMSLLHEVWQERAENGNDS